MDKFSEKFGVSFSKRSSYSFIEVEIFPPIGTRYFQLIKDGVPQPYIYSEEHLLKCFDLLCVVFK